MSPCVYRSDTDASIYVCAIKAHGGRTVSAGVCTICEKRCDGADCPPAPEAPVALTLSAGMRPPENIPEDYDPEQERRRAKQGGCCGKPSKA